MLPWEERRGVVEHIFPTYFFESSQSYCASLVVVSGSRDSTLRVWDIENGECSKKLEGHVAAVRW